MKLVVVLTCNGRKDDAGKPTSYLGGTLRAVQATAGSELYVRTVVSDGPMPYVHWDHLGGWNVLETAQRLGARHGLRRALHVAAAMDVERLVFLEDDIVPCKNAVARMLSMTIPNDVGFVTCFDMRVVPKGAPAGMHRLQRTTQGGQTAFWSSCALVFPGRIIEPLLQQDWTKLRPDLPDSSDEPLGEAVGKTPWPTIGVHVPSLVEHAGDISNIFAPNYIRKAWNFHGVDFDALSLTF